VCSKTGFILYNFFIYITQYPMHIIIVFCFAEHDTINYWIINSCNLQMSNPHILCMHDNLTFSVYLPCFCGPTVYVYTEHLNSSNMLKKMKYAPENYKKTYIFYFFANFNHKQLIIKYNTMVIGLRSESIFFYLIVVYPQYLS